MSKHAPVVSSAIRIGLCTLLSRITGFVRDILVIQTLGVAWISDAWTFAFQIPNLFRRLFGEGALAAVFVPEFSKLLERDENESAWRLFARTLALLTIVLILVVILIELILLAIWMFAPGDPGAQQEARALALSLTGLMLPFMITICIVALFSSILNSLGSFVPPAVTPVILNLAMIIALVAIAPHFADVAREKVYILGASVLVAGVIQILFLLPVLRRRQVPLRWELDTRDPHVRRMLGNLGPVIFGQGVLIIGAYVDSQICLLFTRLKEAPDTANWFGWTFRYPLEEGANALLYIAQRLYQFPLGVAAISIGVAALPAMTRLIAREDHKGWADELRRSLRLSFFVGALSSAMLITLGESFLRLLFEYKKFNAADTARATPLVVAFGWGMWAFCVQQIVVRGFYSRGDIRTPVIMNLFFVPLNLAISFFLIWQPAIRVTAFGISSAFTASLGVIVGLLLLQRRANTRVFTPAFLFAAAKITLAAALAGIVIIATRNPLDAIGANLHATPLITRSIESFGGMMIGVAVFLLACWLFRLPEPGLILRRFRR
ncbi:MAG: murein biosynthesis integral membrane protein MurJ [Phycisphaerae bacterium]